MRPDDDVKLGKLLKLRGHRQELVFATSLVVVEWYHSFREMRRGLMKNLFAAADYSIVRVVASVVAQAILLCAGHALQFGGESPPPNLMEVKG